MIHTLTSVLLLLLANGGSATSPTTSPSLVPSAAPSPTRSTLYSVFLVAGTTAGSSSGTGGKATSANLNEPRGVWVDSTGLVYWAEGAAECVRKMSSADNIVAKFAGVCTSSGSSGNGGAASSALLNTPVAIVGDSTGRVFISDNTNNLVRVVSNSGIITTYAGTTGSSGNTGTGAATSATLYQPQGAWLSSLGTLYVATLGGSSGFGYMVRAISSSGIISVFAGTGSPGNTGDGGPATSATFNPERVLGMSTGALYISDAASYHRIRLVSPNGIISPFAGTSSGGYGGDGGPPTSATFNVPCGMAVDTTNWDFFIGDRDNYRLRAITRSSNIITTYAGTGSWTYSGNGAAASNAGMRAEDLFMDTNNYLYTSEFHFNVVRVIQDLSPTRSPTRTPTLAPSILPTVAPSLAPTQVPTVVPTVAPSAAPTLLPTILPTVVPTAVPTVSLAPTFKPSSQRSSAYNIDTVAGSGPASSLGTGGRATAATMNIPRQTWLDSAGYMYFSDSATNCLRKYSTSTTIVYDAVGVCQASGTYAGDGGKATSALLNGPVSVQISTASVVYVTDFFNNRIRTVSVAGIITTFAGTGAQGTSGDSGQATAATMTLPHGLWLNSVGWVYFTSYSTHLIRLINPSGIVSLFAGASTSASFSGDGGPPTSAGFWAPERIMADTSESNIFISDSLNQRVRRVSGGVIQTVIGTGSVTYGGESLPGTSANLNYPTGLWVDTDNADLYVSSRAQSRIMVLTATNSLLTTFAGTGTATSTGDGGPATTGTLNNPDGLFRDTNGILYATEYNGNRIRSIFAAAPTVAPSVVPTAAPTSPTFAPTIVPSAAPTAAPTPLPTTVAPSVSPSVLPTTTSPTTHPTVSPTAVPTVRPSVSFSPTQLVSDFSNSPSFKVTNANAFAALNSDGTVLTWGASAMGGDSSSVAGLLVDVAEVVQSKNAFAARTNGGSVVAWGSSTEITGSSAYQSYSTIESLVATEQAFAGVTSSGGVIAFGASCCGGDVDQFGWAQYLTSGVESVTASAGAFCALKSSGSVYCWGSEFAGGGVSSLTNVLLSSVESLSATRSAFAAILLDGSVVTWGSKYAGGDSSAVAGSLTSVSAVVSGTAVFAARTTAGAVVCWGSSQSGGDISDVSSSLASGVKSVVHTGGAFAALKYDGSVVSWGNSLSGGDSSAVAGQLVSVSSVVGTVGAFAAQLGAGGVVAWGNGALGANLTQSTSDRITSVASLHHTNRAFAALQTDKLVVTWGASSFGGDSSSVASYLANGVRLVCANENAFTAIRTDGAAVAWGHTLSVSTGVLTGNFSLVQSCT